MIRWIDKDPEASLDYSLDLTDLVNSGDSIASVAWEAPSDLLVEELDTVEMIARVAISGGVAGATYVVTCLVTLASGLDALKRVMLKVREQ